MKILSLAILYLGFGCFLLSLNYYVKLFLSKDSFTKEELKEIKPFFNEIFTQLKEEEKKIRGILFITFSLLGILLPTFFATNIIANSIIIFAIFYFSLPFLVKYLQAEKEGNEIEEEGNEIEEEISEEESNKTLPFDWKRIVSENYLYIIFAFGLGTLTAFSYNFGQSTGRGFAFFTANFIAAIVLLEYTLISIFSKE